MHKGVAVLSFIFLLFSQESFAQILISGRVFDNESKEALPFVSVQGPDRTGTLADIEGRFSLSVNSLPVSLTFTVIGYESKTLVVANSSEIRIDLKAKSTSLSEVVILPTDNPALRIVRKASENRDKNNPEKNIVFSYNSYNKMHLTLDPESFRNKDPKASYRPKSEERRKDSIETRDFLNNSYVFFSETYATRNFKSTLQDKETITATKVSGIKNPSFGMLASQFQSFTFYTDLISISNKNYLSPLTFNSENRYRFELIDTAYSGNDTVYIITYEPKRGKTFDGLKGKLHINTNGYAVNQVVAEPVVQQDGQFHVKIQQQYKLLGTVWFPEQLTSQLTLTTVNGDQLVDFVGEIRSFIKDIQINPELERKDVSGVANDFAFNAGKKDSLFWEQVRELPLNEKERNTYKVIDSIGESENLERRIKVLEYLISGQVPLGKVSLLMNDIIKVNAEEGARIGVGATTNSRFSRFFAVGGAVGYGISDKRFKYRGDLKFFLMKDEKLTLSAQYLDDLEEPGSSQFQRVKLGLAYSENYRRLTLNRMDEIESIQIGLKARIGNSLTIEPFVLKQDRSVSRYDYRYAAVQENEATIYRQNFVTDQLGLNFRLAIGEKYARIFNKVLAQPTKYPVLQGRIVNNGTLTSSAYPFTGATVQLDHNFPIKLLGALTYRVNAGYVDKAAPYPFLFNGRANFRNGLSVNSFGSFETMRMNEFLSDRYLSANVYYDLKALLFKTEKFKPGFILVGSALVGELRSPEAHRDIEFLVPRKGFYETGLMVTNLYKSNFSAFGVGAFYRLGYYQLDSPLQNLAVKINLTVSFE